MRAEDDRAETVATSRGRLRRRADFLRVGKGRRWHGKAMTIQAGTRDGTQADETASPRFGFTLTKKVGNAVVRNRARRRLREAVRLAPPDLQARDGHDYVIVGRVEALRLSFRALGEELARGIAAVHTHGKQAASRQAHGKRGDANRRGAGDRIAPAASGPERTRPEP